MTYGYGTGLFELLYAGIGIMAICMLVILTIYIIKPFIKNNENEHRNRNNMLNIQNPIVVIVHQPQAIHRIRMPRRMRLPKQSKFLHSRKNGRTCIIT
jgi:hypothetical protein